MSEKNSRYIWDNPVLSKVRVIEEVDYWRKEDHCSLDASCRYLSDTLMINFGIEIAANQIKNRYYYLKKRMAKQPEVKKQLDLKEAENFSKETAVKQKSNYVTNRVTYGKDGMIYSNKLKSLSGNKLNLSKVSYKVMNGPEFAKRIDSIYSIQQKVNHTNAIRLADIIEELALFWGVSPKQLHNRYYYYSKKNKTDYENESLQRDLVKEQKSRIKTLEANLSLLEKTRRGLENHNERLREQVDSLQNSVQEQGTKITVLRNQSLVDFIKMKIANRIALCKMRKIWRR